MQNLPLKPGGGDHPLGQWVQDLLGPPPPAAAPQFPGGQTWDEMFPPDRPPNLKFPWAPPMPQPPLPMFLPPDPEPVGEGLRPVVNPPNLLPLPAEAYPPGFRYPDGTTPGSAPALPQPIFPYQGSQTEPTQQQPSFLSDQMLQQLVQQALTPTPAEPQGDFTSSAFDELLKARQPQVQEPQFQQVTDDPARQIAFAAQMQDSLANNGNAILPILAAAAFGNQINSAQRRSDRGAFAALEQSPDDIAEQYRMGNTRGNPFYG